MQNNSRDKMHVYIPSINVCTWDASIITECTGNTENEYHFDPHTQVTYSHSLSFCVPLLNYLLAF